MGSKTPGRNAPCPCGSGKKYKKCCLEQEQARSRENHTMVERGWTIQPNELDDLSNSVLALVDQGRLDEADAVCEKLRKDYPDVVDGIERQAIVCEARGLTREAARYYREAAAFARRQEGFEDEGIQDWLDRANVLDPTET